MRLIIVFLLLSVAPATAGETGVWNSSWNLWKNLVSEYGQREDRAVVEAGGRRLRTPAFCESLKDETVEAVIAGGCDKLSSSQGYTLQVKETINQIKWDAFISKVVEIRVDIEISNNLITKLDFSNVTTFDSKSVKIMNCDSLTKVSFSSNCAITRLEIRGNKQLEEIEDPDRLPNVTTIVIRFNPLLPAFFVNQQRLYRKGTNDEIQLFGECTFPQNISKLSDLNGCKLVLGNLIFVPGATRPPEKGTHLSLVEGDVELADIPLAELGFLKGTLVTGTIKSENCEVGLLFGELVQLPAGCGTVTTTTTVSSSTVTGPEDDYEDIDPPTSTAARAKPSRSKPSGGGNGSDDGSSSFSTLQLALIGLAVLGVVAVIVLIIYCLCCKKKPTLLPPNPAQKAIENETDVINRQLDDYEKKRRDGISGLGNPFGWEALEDSPEDTDMYEDERPPPSRAQSPALTARQWQKGKSRAAMPGMEKDGASLWLNSISGQAPSTTSAVPATPATSTTPGRGK